MEDELRSALDKADAAPQHAFKYTQFQDDPASTHSKIVSLVPPATRVLEFGCATGYMTEVLKNRLGCTVVGIEIDPRSSPAGMPAVSPLRIALVAR